MVRVYGSRGPIPNMMKQLLVLNRRMGMAIAKSGGALCGRDEGAEEGAGLRAVALQTRRGAKSK